MNTMSFFTTPSGDEMVILPRTEFEAMKDAVARTREVAAYRAGELPGLTPDEAIAFAESASPLAFWRKRAGFSQAVLAQKVGIAQNYLSDIETGKRDGPVGLWLKISSELGLPIDMLVDEDRG